MVLARQVRTNEQQLQYTIDLVKRNDNQRALKMIREYGLKPAITCQGECEECKPVTEFKPCITNLTGFLKTCRNCENAKNRIKGNCAKSRITSRAKRGRKEGEFDFGEEQVRKRLNVFFEYLP
jgi:hypothetical protein